MWIQDDELCVSLSWRSYDHDKTRRGRKRRKIRWFLEKQFGTKNCIKKGIGRERNWGKFCVHWNAIENRRNINKFIYSWWMKKRTRGKNGENSNKHWSFDDYGMQNVISKMLFITLDAQKVFLVLHFVLLFDSWFHSWNCDEGKSCIYKRDQV